MVKARKFTRRSFIAAAFLGLPFSAAIDALWIEPRWVKVRRLGLANGPPNHRLVHITDIHYRGERSYLERIVRKINAVTPDFICITGDLFEDKEHSLEALEILAALRRPVYAVPGNHDYWSKAAFEPAERFCAATGGAWLMDRQVLTQDERVAIFGLSSRSLRHPPIQPRPNVKNLCLMHFPAWADKLGNGKFDLILAGHSHGGQVRLPFYGPILVPYAVEKYDLGLFQTPAGPLYVNPGLGWHPVPIRFRCRPEITLIEM
jgi:predicted MPP superfamily phosphohydrolase